MKLDYKKMTIDKLLDLIKKCQKELLERGFATKFRMLDNQTKGHEYSHSLERMNLGG